MIHEPCLHRELGFWEHLNFKKVPWANKNSHLLLHHRTITGINELCRHYAKVDRSWCISACESWIFHCLLTIINPIFEIMCDIMIPFPEKKSQALNSISGHITKASMKAKTINGMFGPQANAARMFYGTVWHSPHFIYIIYLHHDQIVRWIYPLILWNDIPTVTLQNISSSRYNII